MARPFKVSELLTRAKYAADMEGQSFISDAEWKTYLSTAYAELFSILVESGWRYFESEHQITSDGVNHSYLMPDAFLTLIGVDYQVNANSGERRPLQPLMVQQRNDFTGVGGSAESVCYAMIGDKVRLYPKPKSGQVYHLVYVPQPSDLSSSADNTVVDVVTPDGEAFLLWHMAFRALSKEESDTRDARGEREAARERVYSWAALRAINEPHRVTVQQNTGYPIDPGDYWGRG